MKKNSPLISEDDGHPLDAVLDFYTVQNVMEKNEIEYKNRRKILLDTLIALKDKAKKDFDVFHTRVIFRFFLKKNLIRKFRLGKFE